MREKNPYKCHLSSHPKLLSLQFYKDLECHFFPQDETVVGSYFTNKEFFSLFGAPKKSIYKCKLCNVDFFLRKGGI